MSSHKHGKGCKEYSRLSRRRFVGLSAGALAAAAVPGWLPRVVLADSASSERDVLVSIFLRGGADGLTLCVPHGEDAYYRHRPGLAIPRPDSGGPNAALDLDGFFGLPPALAPLREAYDDGALLAVQACGLTHGTRSHFDAMFFTEVGMPQPPASVFTGWLGRHLQSTAPTLQGGVLRAVGLGYGLPRSLVGGPQAVPINDLGNAGFREDLGDFSERQAALDAMFREAPDPARTAADNSLRTVELLESIDFDSYQPSGGATYPEGEFGYSLRSAAALIKADVGVEAVAIDLGGWDTHDFQGPLDGGMAALMRSFAEGLAAFHKDLFSADRRDVTVVAQSEFGRNVFENGSQGTDHGHGNTMFLLGGQVDGGRVLADWPGLERDQLFEGQDLAITIDYRDILTEVVLKRLGNADYRNVFPDPDYTPVERGVIRA